MKMNFNDLRKLNLGVYYAIISINDPEYTKELTRSEILTDEEQNCISTVIDEKMDISEQILATSDVFGKPAMIQNIF